MEANVEYKKETVTVMMTAFGIWNVEQEIVKANIFQLVPTAALTLFQVRLRRIFLCYENEIIVGKGPPKDVTWVYQSWDFSDFLKSNLSRPFEIYLVNIKSIRMIFQILCVSQSQIYVKRKLEFLSPLLK